MALVIALWTLFASGPELSPATASVLAPIAWHTPEDVEAAWRKIRLMPGSGARVAAIADQGLEHWACSGLVDLQALDAAQDAGLAWKDRVRGRGWSQPALARALIVAHAAWHRAHPTLALAVGDVAQAGCGQVDPGVLTRLVGGDEATQLLARATPEGGALVLRETLSAQALADDPSRFSTPLEQVLLERRIIAADPMPAHTVLVQIRRYRALAVPAPAALAELESIVVRTASRAELATTTEWRDPDGTRVRRRHWIDRASARQVVVVSTGDDPTLRLDDVRDVRIGPWAPGRPGAFPSETRWLAQPGPQAPEAASTRTWQAWQLLEEGAHATHMAGRDADLSYPIADPKRRFTDAVDLVDLPATWEWFETLTTTASALGTPIDAIMVGPRTYARILRELPKARQSPLIRDRIVRVIRDHDDHQHVRITPTTAKDAAAARAALTTTRASQGTSPATSR